MIRAVDGILYPQDKVSSLISCLSKYPTSTSWTHPGRSYYRKVVVNDWYPGRVLGGTRDTGVDIPLFTLRTEGPNEVPNVLNCVPSRESWIIYN